jgi:hypothetical protein
MQVVKYTIAYDLLVLHKYGQKSGRVMIHEYTNQELLKQLKTYSDMNLDKNYMWHQL